MRVSVDLGYGFVKAVSENGKRVMFPSVVAPGPTGTAVAEALGSKADYTVSIEKAGKASQYLVGDAAAAVRNGVRAWEGDHTEHHNAVVLYATALALLGAGPEPVELACGLPLSVFGTQRETLSRFLEGLTVKVRINGNEPRFVTVGTVFVFPQAVGAYSHATRVFTPINGQRSLLTGTVGIVDIGYRTTDYFVVQKTPRGLMYRDDLSGSMDAGHSRVFQDVKRALDARAGWTISVQTVERLITYEGAVAMIKGKPYDLQPDLEEAEAHFADTVLSHLKAQWGQELDLLTGLVIAGGGGNRIFKHFQTLYPEAVLVPDPVYANAIGYLAAWLPADNRPSVSRSM